MKPCTVETEELAAGFASAVQRRRAQLGLSLAELGKRMGGIGSGHVAHLLHPAHAPGLNTQVRFAVALGCRVSDLLAEAEAHVAMDRRSVEAMEASCSR